MMRTATLTSLAMIALSTAAGVAACGSEGGSGVGTSSSGSTSTSGGFVGADGGAGGTNFDACGTTRKKAEKVPVDMIIGLDTSFSMDFDSKWPNVRDALKAFVSNPAYADLGLGLQFFPLRKQCSVPDYESPAVPLALQPQAAAPIFTALDGQQMFGGTPMVPLLQGLRNYLVANAKPTRKPVIVLTTDGIPDLPADTCPGGQLPNTLENAVAVAGEAFRGSPSITTFVIGVGGELNALDAIAAAGGTKAATLVDTGESAQQAILTALDNIRRQSIPCDYDIPPGTIDPKSTNVTYTSSSVVKPLVFVGNEESCAKSGDGWYFDDEAAPKKVILCNSLCETVKKDDLGSIDLVFGCPRVEIK